MARRTPISKSEIDTLIACGLRPCALDRLPNGGLRYHFEPPREPANDDLDKELAELEARHGDD